jgi:antibiotic biosynthesis monooxygenase (ABM) superfamily enzyme
MSTTDKPAEEPNSPIHIVITRRVRPGREAEFQDALREIFQASFGHGGVLGASMIVPPPGSGSSEFGILRTFVNEAERDAFYESPLFKEWEHRIAPLTEDTWTYRPLHGLEAWFRAPQRPPARWRMALLTWIAVWPVSFLVQKLALPVLAPVLPTVLLGAVTSAGVVVVLTWVAMPWLVKTARRWLQPPSHPALGAVQQPKRTA